MIQFISEFGLPKEFSKKKKFDFHIGMFIPNNEWSNTDVNWSINIDLQKVYLTIEECAKVAIENALNNGVSEDIIKDGYVAIAMFTYPASYLNEVPIARDTQNHPIDCEWNKDKLSFNFTFRTLLSEGIEKVCESINISCLKIRSITTKCEDGKYIIASVDMYPVIDNTTF